MNEEKRNRIAAAITVNVLLLIVILAAVVIYQLVSISAMRNQTLAIKSEINRLQTEIEHDKSTLEYWKSEHYLLNQAYEYGFKNGN